MSSELKSSGSHSTQGESSAESEISNLTDPDPEELDSMSTFNLKENVRLCLFAKFRKFCRYKYQSSVLTAIFTSKPYLWLKNLPRVKIVQCNQMQVFLLPGESIRFDTSVEDMNSYLAHLRDKNGDSEIYWFFYEEEPRISSPIFHVVFSIKPIDVPTVHTYLGKLQETSF